MPIYDFRCKSCKHEWTVMCSIATKDDPKVCPECGNIESEQVILGAPSLGDPVRLGVRKMDDGFREVLSKVSEKTYRSNLKDKLSR